MLVFLGNYIRDGSFLRKISRLESHKQVLGTFILTISFFERLFFLTLAVIAIFGVPEAITDE